MTIQPRRMHRLLFLIVAGAVLGACGPSAEEVATMTAAAWTDTPSATATAMATITPSNIPTFTPTFAPTPMGGGGLFVRAYNSDFSRESFYLFDTEGKTPTHLIQIPVGYDNAYMSPDMSRVALNSVEDGNLYMMNADGSGLTMLAELPDPMQNLGWSPDGTAIWISASPLGASNTATLYLVNTNGGKPIRLTTQSARMFDPIWSPDGTRLAYIRSSEYVKELYMVSTNGGEPTLLTQNLAYDYEWSRDGTRLVYTDYSSSTSKLENIYVANVDGSKPTLVASDEPFLSVDFVALLQDGASILVEKQKQSATGGVTNTLQTIKIDGTESTELAELGEEYWISDCELSPDGTHIAYAHTIPCPPGQCPTATPANVCIMRADGGNIVCAPENQELQATLLTWSPDGKNVAYFAYSTTQAWGQGEFTVAVMNVETGHIFELVKSGDREEFGMYYGLHWSRDSAHVAGVVFSHPTTVEWEDRIFVARADGSGLFWLNEWLPEDIYIGNVFDWGL